MKHRLLLTTASAILVVAATLTAQQPTIDAAVGWGNGKVYFFGGDSYIRYDIAADRADPGYPKPIRGLWRGLSFSRVDAAVNWGNGKAYFFRGDEYVRYDIAADRADAGYPKRIAGSGSWPGLPFDRIDAAVNWGDGKAYFFRGDQYVRYDIAQDKTDPGYPKNIRTEWRVLASVECARSFAPARTRPTFFPATSMCAMTSPPTTPTLAIRSGSRATGPDWISAACDSLWPGPYCTITVPVM